MNTIFMRALALLFFTAAMLQAQVSQLVNDEDCVAVGTTNLNGSGSFRFALVNLKTRHLVPTQPTL